MDTTSKLSLPYIMASQAQKHVTHNEALRILDALVHLSIKTRSSSDLPASASDGDRFIVSPEASGQFTGHEGEIAAFQDGAVAFLAPQAGWTAWIEDESVFIVWDGTIWADAPSSIDLSEPLPMVGINTSADETNRLSVGAPAALLTNDGDDFRLVTNKATTNDTASHIFQTNFSGRAELGLTGSDAFEVRVSSDGAQWASALTVDPVNATVHAPAGLRFEPTTAPLAHYDEGTMVPVLLGSSDNGAPVYAANIGRWTRIGNLVNINGRIVWSSLGGLTGFVSLGGLPFACQAGLENRAAMTSGWYNSLAMGANVTMFGGFTQPGTDTIRLWGAKNAHEGTNLLLQESQLSENGEFFFSCNYRL